MKSTSKIALSFIAIACLSGLLTWKISVPSTWQGIDSAFHWPLFYSSIYTIIHLGAAVLFLMGLGAYKAKLRIAYSFVAVSVALVAIGLIQVPVLNAFNLLDTAWVNSGAILLPFIVCGIAAYTGVRMLAGLVGAKSIFANIKFVLPVLLVAVVLSSFLPHVATEMAEIGYDVSNALMIFLVGTFAACGMIVLRVRSHIGSHYKKAMAWLGLGYFASVIICLISLAFTLSTDRGVNIILDVTLVISGLVYLKAGQAFAETKEV